jgi:hypothetical protein
MSYLVEKTCEIRRVYGAFFHRVISHYPLLSRSTPNIGGEHLEKIRQALTIAKRIFCRDRSCLCRGRHAREIRETPTKYEGQKRRVPEVAARIIIHVCAAPCFQPYIANGHYL